MYSLHYLFEVACNWLSDLYMMCLPSNTNHLAGSADDKHQDHFPSRSHSYEILLYLFRSLLNTLCMCLIHSYEEKQKLINNMIISQWCTKKAIKMSRAEAGGWVLAGCPIPSFWNCYKILRTRNSKAWTEWCDRRYKKKMIIAHKTCHPPDLHSLYTNVPNHKRFSKKYHYI